MQQVVHGDARNVSYRLDLIRFQATLAADLSNSSDRQQATDTLKQAMVDAEQLVAELSAIPRLGVERVSVFSSIAAAASIAQDRKTALDYQRKGESEMEELVRQHPDSVDYHSALGRLYMNVAWAIEGNGDRTGALARYRRATAEFERVSAGKGPVDASWLPVAWGHRLVGDELGFLGNLTGKSEEHCKAIAIYERVLASHPQALSNMYVELARSYFHDRNWSAVIENANKALLFPEKNYAADPSKPGRLDSLALPLQYLAESHAQMGDLAKAIEIHRRLTRLREQSASLDPSDAFRAQLTADQLGYLANVLIDGGDRQGSIEATLGRLLSLIGSSPKNWKPRACAVIGPRDMTATRNGLVLSTKSSPRRSPAANCCRSGRTSIARIRTRRPGEDWISRTAGSQTIFSGWAISPNRSRLSARLGIATGKREKASDWRDAASLQARIAGLLGLQGDRAGMEQGLRMAIESQRHSCTLAEQARKTSPAGATALRDVSTCEVEIMRLFIRLAEQRQALEYGRRAVSHETTQAASSDPYFQDSSSVRPDAVLLAWQLAGDRADYTGILAPAAATPDAIQYLIAHGYRHLGIILRDDGPSQPARDAFHKAVEIFDSLVREAPSA